ncbi:hypothetical protein ACOMHN_029466 [Nucella lapillus]
MASSIDDVLHNMTSTTWKGHNNVTEIANWTYPEDCTIYPVSRFVPWNNPKDVMSRETHLLIADIIDVYLLLPFLLICLPFNVINIIVFWKHGIKERINLCLVCLSFSDIIVVSCSFVLDFDRVYCAFANIDYKPCPMEHQLHTHFLAYPGRRVIYHNKGECLKDTTLEQCLEHCSNDVKVRTCDYWRINARSNQCCPQEVTWIDVDPNHWVEDASCDHYQKMCV